MILKYRAIAIVLFFCLVVPMATTYTIYSVRKGKIRKEVKHKIIEGLNRNEFTLLRFSKEDMEAKLRWEHSKEFEFEGEMYDVVEKEEHGDTIVFWCWWDKEETALGQKLKTLASKAQGNDPQQKETQKRVNQFLKSLYFSSINLTQPYQQEATGIFFIYANSYTSIFISPPVPPPDFVCSLS